MQAKRQGLGNAPPPVDDEEQRVGLGTSGHFDQDIYGGNSIRSSKWGMGYDTSIAVTDEPDVSTFCNKY